MKTIRVTAILGLLLAGLLLTGYRPVAVRISLKLIETQVFSSAPRSQTRPFRARRARVNVTTIR